jgi:hypothetical protein
MSIFVAPALALFSSKLFYKMDNITLSFIFDKYIVQSWTN